MTHQVSVGFQVRVDARARRVPRRDISVFTFKKRHLPEAEPRRALGVSGHARKGPFKSIINESDIKKLMINTHRAGDWCAAAS